MSFFSSYTNIPGHGEKGHARIASSSALVIGAGGLGGPVAESLVRAGFGKVSVIDIDVVEASNLGRQMLFNESDIGSAKAECASFSLSAVYKDLEVQGIIGNAYDIDFSGYDIVLDCSDDLKLKASTSQRCAQANIPCIVGSVYRFNAQVFVFAKTGDKQQKSVYDVFSSYGGSKSCSATGVYFSHLLIVGGFMAQECIRYTVNPEGFESKLIDIDTVRFRVSKYNLDEGKVSQRISGNNADLEVDAVEQFSDVQTILLEDAEKNGLSMIDVRSHEEYMKNPYNCPNIPMAEVISDATPEAYSGTAFICASGARARMCAYHVNVKNGTKTAVAIVPA